MSQSVIHVLPAAVLARAERVVRAAVMGRWFAAGVMGQGRLRAADARGQALSNVLPVKVKERLPVLIVRVGKLPARCARGREGLEADRWQDP